MATKRDNATFARKVSLRLEVRKHIPDLQAVLETHGGVGALYRSCYADIADGVVFETNPIRTGPLAEQRPTWRVYEVDAAGPR